MKKLKSLILTAGMLISVVSCSPAENKKMPAVTVQADELSETAYRKSAVELPDEIRQIYISSSYNNGEKMFLLGRGGSAACVWTANGDFTEPEPIGMSDFEISEIYSANVTEDGKIVEMLVRADYGDLPDPDRGSDDFNAELYDDSAEYSLEICLYGTDGSKLSENTVTGYTGTVDGSMLMGELVSDGKNILVQINGSYELFTIEGGYIGELKTDGEETVSAVGRDKNGIVLITEKDGAVSLHRIGGNSAQLMSAEFICELGETVKQITAGTGGYTLFLRTRSRIYGVNEKGEISALFNCSAAGVNGDEVSGFSMDSEGNFTICESSYAGGSVKVKKYTQCDPSELENIPLLEVGVREGMNHDLKEVADAYNDLQSDVRVQLTEYEGYNGENDADSISKLESDLISGNIPDVFITDSASGRFCEINLMQKNVFCDLTQFMENDNKITPDNIFTSVMNVLKNGDEVPLIPSGWTLGIGYVGKSSVIDEYLDGIDKFDIDGYLDFLEKLPKDVGVMSYNDEDTVLNRFTRLSWMKWVDVESASCSFDSDSFIRFLKYAAAGEGSLEEQMIYGMQETDYLKEKRQYIDDTALLTMCDIGNFSSYMECIKGSFGGEKLTVIGLPSSEGGCIEVRSAGQYCGISESSDMKEQAWDFIKYFFDSRLDNTSEVWGFPLTVSGFEEEYERLKDGVDDEELGKGWYYWDGAEYIDLGSITEADKKQLLDWLDEAVPPQKGMDNSDDTPYNIYYEETDRFFAGECTAERCAEIIQSRMKVYLSEQFG